MILPHTEVLLMVDSNLKKLIISASLIIFSTSQIIAYFVIRTIVDGLLGNDMKIIITLLSISLNVAMFKKSK